MAGVFGRYALLRSLGHGDMADVWKASLRGPAEFRKAFALKILLQELSAGRDFVDVFVEEARVLASLSHPNIVQVTDFGEEAGRYFVATEFVHGKDLDAIQKRMAARGLRMPMEMALLIGIDLARALGSAHARTAPDGTPVIHREVFPKNVLVSYHAQVKLADFRSSRVRSVAPAKLVYRSPEQTRSEALDRRSDLFSLGLLVLDLITGAKPAEGMPRDPASFAFPEKETATLSERAREILRKAVSLDRNERYTDAGELEAAFLEILSAKGLLEARRSLRSTLEKLFLDEMKAEAADDPAAPIPPAPGEAPPPIARDTVSVPVTPRRKAPGERPSGAGDRVSGSGAALPPPPPPRATLSGSGRVPVQPSPTANTAPGMGELGTDDTGSGAGAAPEMSTAPGIAGPRRGLAAEVLDDEPGTIDGDPPLLRGSASGLDAFTDDTESVRKPNATRVAQPSPSTVADLSGLDRAPIAPEPSRSFREDLFPREKAGKNRTLLMALAAGGGALVAAMLGFAFVSLIFGGAAPATETPTPTATPVAAASAEETASDSTPEPTATAAPAKTAKPPATPRATVVAASTPRPTPTPRPATPRPTVAATRVAAITPKPPTPTPVPVPAGPTGDVTIRSKTPLDAYIDGKKVKLSTPIRLSAGVHKLRVVDEENEVDLPKDIEVTANGRLEVDIDIERGKIEVRKK